MGSESIQTPSISAGSAAPASGKYGGFGSEDIAKLGYGKEGQFNQAYDPYTKAQSATSHITHQVNNTKPFSKKDEPNKKKDKKKKDKSDSDSSSSSSSSDQSEDEKPKKKSKKEETKKVEKTPLNIHEAPKATRTIGGVTIIGSEVQF